MEPLVFVETRTFAPFFLVLVAAGVAVGAWRLLWPWPLRPARVAGFLAVLWIAAICAWMTASQQLVVIDRAHQEVREGRSLMRLAKTQARPFSTFAAVIVERSGGGYAYRLDGDAGGPVLGTSGDVLEAERLARGVAVAGGWQAKRRGYRLEGPVAGSVEHMRTRDGANVVGMNLRDAVRVVAAQGEENL